MAYIQERQANTAELLSGAFRELAGVRRQLALYFLGFAALAVFAQVASSIGGLAVLLGFLGYFGAQYWLYQSMLAKSGMLQDAGWRVVEFFGMALVLIIPIAIGLNLFTVPGLILIGKWIMAPTFLVARRQHLIQSIGDSWRASDGSTLHLTIAVTAICAVWIIAFLPLAVIGGIGGFEVGGMVFWLWCHVLPVLLAGLSVSAYKLLSDETASLSEVFA